MIYSTIPTQVGAAKLRNASLLGQTVNITRIAFGDGNGAEYEPTGQETELKNQVYECPPNRIEEEPTAPSWIELEAVIPSNVGGWYLREVGCYDDAGDLIFIGNLPSSFKPSGEAGVIKDLVFEMVYDAVAADVVTIKINPNVIIATRKYVDDQDAKHVAKDDPHTQYERKDNAANNDDVDEESTEDKHIKLPQFWRALTPSRLIDKLWLGLAAKIFPVGAAIPWFTDEAPDGFGIMKGQAFDIETYVQLAEIWPEGIIPDMRGCGVIGKEDGETIGDYEEGQVKSHGHPNSTVSSTDIGSKNTSSDTHSHTYSVKGNTKSVTADGSNNTNVASNIGLNSTTESDTHYHSVSIGSHVHTVAIALFGAQNTINHRKINWIVRLA